MARRSNQGPISLGDAMKRYVSRIDKGHKLAEATVAEYWTAVAGPHIADHTDVQGLRSGELLVAVDSSAWATELSAMAEDLKQRVNREAGKDLVAAIRFTVSQRVEHRTVERTQRKEAERRYGGDRVTPRQLSEAEKAAVERSVSSIKNPELRETALRATLRDLEWKKGLEDPKSPQGDAESATGPETGLTP